MQKDDKSILIVGNFLSASLGTRSVCEDFAERLIEAGWNVITTSSKMRRMERVLDMFGTVWSSRHQYRLASIDVFSGLAFIWAEMVCFLLKRIGKPYILILHGGNLPEFSRRWPGRVTRLLQSASKVVAPSPYLLENMKFYRSNITLIPNPIDITKYSFCPRNPPRPILIWLRAFHNIYNPPLAVFVIALLNSRFSGFQLLMGGGDKGDGSFQKTKQQAELSGVSHQIIFSGKIPNKDVPHWLHNGDIFINTTNYDNTPVSVLEAMACGLCVVSTNVGGLPFLLHDGKDALLVPPNDPVSMVTAIQRILTEPGLALNLSINARKLVEQFDWHKVYPLWEDLFQNINKP